MSRDQIITFHFIRHGNKIGHAGDPELTPEGKVQATKTGKYLKGKDINKIISSTYRRTKETAGIINKFLNIDVTYDDRLRERMNWGSISDQPLDEFLKEWEYSNYHRDFKPKAGLSSNESSKNILELIKEIIKKGNSENILLVTHGGVISDLLRTLFTEKELLSFNPEFMQKLDQLIHECSITTLIYKNNKFELKCIGSTKHIT